MLILTDAGQRKIGYYCEKTWKDLEKGKEREERSSQEKGNLKLKNSPAKIKSAKSFKKKLSVTPYHILQAKLIFSYLKQHNNNIKV